MQRVAYLVVTSGAFLKLLTLHRCHLTNPAEIRNPAKIMPELDLGWMRKNDRISAGAGFGAEFRYSPRCNVCHSAIEWLLLCLRHSELCLSNILFALHYRIRLSV